MVLKMRRWLPRLAFAFEPETASDWLWNRQFENICRRFFRNHRRRVTAHIRPHPSGMNGGNYETFFHRPVRQSRHIHIESGFWNFIRRIISRFVTDSFFGQRYRTGFWRNKDNVRIFWKIRNDFFREIGRTNEIDFQSLTKFLRQKSCFVFIK